MFALSRRLKMGFSVLVPLFFSCSFFFFFVLFLLEAYFGCLFWVFIFAYLLGVGWILLPCSCLLFWLLTGFTMILVHRLGLLDERRIFPVVFCLFTLSVYLSLDLALFYWLLFFPFWLSERRAMGSKSYEQATLPGIFLYY